MAAGNRIERQYPASKIKPKLSSEQLAAQMAEFEAANGPVKTLPIFVRGASRTCSRKSCSKPAPYKEDGNGRHYYCSQKCSQMAKSENGWSARVGNV